MSTKNTMPKKSTSAPVKKRSSKSKKPRLLSGMKDILPQEQMYWEYIIESATQASRAYSYQRVDVPVIEEYQLFTRAIGEHTALIENELYEFEAHEEEDHVALRPDFTPGMARAYIEHGMKNFPQPVKMWTNGPVFRSDKPQAGRYRQFHQFNWEIMGSNQPALDAEMISLGKHLLSDFGLQVMAFINYLGCRECQPTYVSVLKEYYKTHRKNICEQCKIDLPKNPLRLLECKEEACRAINENAPQSVDHLCEPCREHFMKVLEYLDEGDVLYHLQPRMTRGCDYYSHTVFEFVLVKDQQELHPLILIGGGRYNYLLSDLGAAEPTPAIGMSMGIERVILALKESGVPVSQPPKTDVFLAQIGETARKRALQLLEELRGAEIAVTANVSKNGLSDQLALATKSEARMTLILGQKEMIDKTIIVRDMENGSQETILQSKLIDFLKKYLKK